MTRFRLITFDLDDTLWPCAPVIDAAEAALAAWLAEQAPRLAERHDAASLRERRLALARTRPEIAHDLTRVRREALAALLVECGYADALADEAMALFRRARNQVQPFDDVRPALLRLRACADCRLVAVTNGNAEVAATPLADCFHHALTAAEVGAARPHPALFEHAMRWAAVAPATTLHVGDDPVNDVDAARRAGIAAVWVNRAERAWPDGLAPPAVEVRDLAALLQWLDAGPGPDADPDQYAPLTNGVGVGSDAI